MMNDNGKPKVIGEMGIVTGRLIECLRKGKAGDVVTDAQLEAQCTKSVCCSEPGYHHLRTAIQYCIKNYQIYWKRIRGEGMIKCALDSEKVQAAQGYLQRSGRASRSGMTLLNITDINAMQEDDQLRSRALAAQLGTIALLGRTHTQKQLMEKGVSLPLRLNRLLAGFIIGDEQKGQCHD